jgi:hypothetical protein
MLDEIIEVEEAKVLKVEEGEEGRLDMRNYHISRDE